jgi:hypothetical protein
VAETERLDGRDHEIWARYVSGWTQARLAAEYDVSQQRISQVLGEVRATIGDAARTDAALLAAERADALLAAVWPAAMEGDTRAVMAALRVLERQAKAMGTDAVEPLRVTLDRRLDVEGELVATALGAALEALAVSGLDGERQEALRVYAIRLAEWKLLGGVGERPVPPAGAAPEAAEPEKDLMDDYRKFCEAEGIDPDEDQDDEDGDDE